MMRRYPLYNMLNGFLFALVLLPTAADCAQNNIPPIYSLGGIVSLIPDSPDPEVYKPTFITLKARITSYPAPCDTRILKTLQKSFRYAGLKKRAMKKALPKLCVLARASRHVQVQLFVTDSFAGRLPALVRLNKTSVLLGEHIYNSKTTGPGIILHGIASIPKPVDYEDSESDL